MLNLKYHIDFLARIQRGFVGVWWFTPPCSIQNIILIFASGYGGGLWGLMIYPPLFNPKYYTDFCIRIRTGVCGVWWFTPPCSIQNIILIFASGYGGVWGVKYFNTPLPLFNPKSKVLIILLQIHFSWYRKEKFTSFKKLADSIRVPMRGRGGGGGLVRVRVFPLSAVCVLETVAGCGWATGISRDGESGGGQVA